MLCSRLLHCFCCRCLVVLSFPIFVLRVLSYPLPPHPQHSPLTTLLSLCACVSAFCQERPISPNTFFSRLDFQSVSLTKFFGVRLPRFLCSMRLACGRRVVSHCCSSLFVVRRSTTFELIKSCGGIALLSCDEILFFYRSFSRRGHTLQTRVSCCKVAW